MITIFIYCLQKELSDQVLFKVPDGGMSVWTTFVKHDLKVIARKAFSHRLTMKDGTAYDIGRQHFNAVRLGFASLNFKEQLQAVKIVREVMTD